MSLSLAITIWTDDKTGKKITRYTPVYTAECTATGTLHFACWEVWTDDAPAVHRQAQSNAIGNARIVLAQLANNI